MPGQRQDYILRQIELLRQAVARLANKRNDETLEPTLQLALHLQEKLFAMPPVEFLRQPVDAQVNSLMANESKPAGQAKCLTYAELLEQTARLYEFRDRRDLAAGARQLALHVALHVALDGPAEPEKVGNLIKDLVTSLAPLDLLAPVRKLLDEYIRRAG